jgi:hypothetical protein
VPRTAGGALREAIAYAQARQAFGRPICEFQAIQFMTVDMAMKLEAAKLLVYRAACGAGQGLPSIYDASMGKCFANEMVIEVTNLAMQIFGGYGYSKEFPVERMLRDAGLGGRRRYGADAPDHPGQRSVRPALRPAPGKMSEGKRKGGPWGPIIAMRIISTRSTDISWTGS